MNGMENEKLRINMLSSSEKVAGQGVSGAYRELVRLLHRDAKDQLIVTENLPVEADVTHFHTIDFPYYLSTFQKKRSGRKIGYVHFLPDTLEGSLKIPFFLIYKVWNISYFFTWNTSRYQILDKHGIDHHQVFHSVVKRENIAFDNSL